MVPTNFRMGYHLPSSPSSKINKFSKDTFNNFAILKASFKEGSYLFFSIAIIVCLVTLVLFASSICVKYQQLKAKLWF